MMHVGIPKEKKNRSEMINTKEVEEVNRILAEFDWNAYSDEVDKRVSKEIDAYARARALSLAHAHEYVFI